jgi:putative aldouronate transport system substrate-binding protein
MLRKVIATILVAIAFGTAAFAAGGAESSATQSSAPVQIEMWLGKAVSEAADPPADWILYKVARERFNIDLKVSWLPSTLNDQDTKINTAAAANQLPDFFQINREVWVRLVKMGLLGKTDAMWAHMPTRTAQYLANPIDRTAVSYKGAMYALPVPGAMPRTEGLVIRKDWLDKLALKVPTTLDELLVVAKAFTELDPDGNGKNDTYGIGGYIEPTTPQMGLGPRFDWIFGAFGAAGTWDLRANSFGLNIRKAAYPEGLAYMNRVVQAGVIDPDWPNLKKDEFRARWKQGRFGIMWEQFAALAASGNYAPFDKNFPNGEWLVIDPPKGPRGESSNGIDVANYRYYTISAKAEKEGKHLAIAKLLEWMSTEGYYTIGWGKEGVNYNLNADKVPTLDAVGNAPAIPRENSYASATVTQARSLVFYNSPVELAARYPTFTSVNGRTIGPLQYWDKFKQTAYTACWGASLIDPPNNWADISRFYNENIVKFAMGQQALSGYATFLAGMDRLGAKDWEAAARAKLDDIGMIQ